MKIMKLLVAAALACTSTLALAHRCPAEMKRIDAALPKAKISKEQMTQVRKLRADGETLHKEGKHKESTDALDQARKLLGI